MFNELTLIFSFFFVLLLVIFLIVGLIKPTLLKIKKKNIIIIFLLGCIIPVFFFARIYFIYENYRSEINSAIKESQELFTEMRMDANIAFFSKNDKDLAIEITEELMAEIINNINKIEKIYIFSGFGTDSQREEIISALEEQYKIARSMKRRFLLLQE